MNLSGSDSGSKRDSKIALCGEGLGSLKNNKLNVETMTQI